MGGKGTNTVTQNTEPPPYVAEYLKNLFNRGEAVASLPLYQYAGPTIAGLTPNQQWAVQNVGGAQGMSLPYVNAATQYLGAGATPTWPSTTQWSEGALDPYMNPYTEKVIDATMANLNKNYAIQGRDLMSSAIRSGNAFGGDRMGLGLAELGRNQALATGQVISGLENQGYRDAMNDWARQQQLEASMRQADAARAMSAAPAMAGFGRQAQQDVLGGSQALMGAGSAEQAIAQAMLSWPYQQFQQQQQYPFYTTQFLSGLGGGAGSAGSSTTSQQPGANPLSTIAGLGMTGLGIYGAGANLGLWGGAGAASSALPAAASLALIKRGGRVPPAPMGDDMFDDLMPYLAGGRAGYAAGGPVSSLMPPPPPGFQERGPETWEYLTSHYADPYTAYYGSTGPRPDPAQVAALQGMFANDAAGGADMARAALAGGQEGQGGQGGVYPENMGLPVGPNGNVDWSAVSNRPSGGSPYPQFPMPSPYGPFSFLPTPGGMQGYGIGLPYVNPSYFQQPSPYYGGVGPGGTAFNPMTPFSPQGTPAAGFNVPPPFRFDLPENIMSPTNISRDGGDGSGGGGSGDIPGSDMTFPFWVNDVPYYREGLEPNDPRLATTPPPGQPSAQPSSVNPWGVLIPGPLVDNKRGGRVHRQFGGEVGDDISTLDLSMPDPFGGYDAESVFMNGLDGGSEIATTDLAAPHGLGGFLPDPSGSPIAPRGLGGDRRKIGSSGGLDPWLSLMMAGMGTMASRNPSALGAIGEGGLKGLGYWSAAQQAKAEQAWREKQMKSREDYQGRSLDIQKSRNEAVERHYENIDKKPIIDHSGATTRVYHPGTNEWVDTGVPTTDAQRAAAATTNERARLGLEQKRVDLEGRRVAEQERGKPFTDNKGKMWRLDAEGRAAPVKDAEGNQIAGDPAGKDKTPALVATADELVKRGVYPDFAAAWKAVKSRAAISPVELRTKALKWASDQKDRYGRPQYDSPEKTAAAVRAYEMWTADDAEGAVKALQALQPKKEKAESGSLGKAFDSMWRSFTGGKDEAPGEDETPSEDGTPNEPNSAAKTPPNAPAIPPRPANVPQGAKWSSKTGAWWWQDSNGKWNRNP